MPVDLTFEQCEEVLKKQHYGHIGCCLDNEPYVLPVTYVYEYGSIYSHTHAGHKIDIMRKNPTVCLQVERVGGAHDWESVICWGTFEEVTDEKELHKIHLMLADQYAAVSADSLSPVSPMIQELNRTKEDVKKSVVYRINIKKTTGKAERPNNIH